MCPATCLQAPGAASGGGAGGGGSGGGGSGGGGGALALVAQATLQALKAVLSSPMSRQEKSRGDWNLLLRSGLNTLLLLGDTGPPGCVVDQVSLLTALTVFLLSTAPDVTTVQPLHALSLHRFTTAMEAKDPLVVSRCFQLLTSVFQAQPAVAVPYIQALGPPLVRYLQAVERSRPQTEDELLAVQEAIRTMEAVLQAAENTQRPPLAAILLPVLISFLLDENALGSAPPASRSLHEAALKELMRLGPQHSAVFRSLMASSPQLKSRLEAAVKGNQESLSAKASAPPRSAKPPPSITLKTNFL
ncbi:HEAT repeat-containing protein 5A-like [Centroberyx affinis]|uniref:HEAT repeat-containing protein 5A-like n=1 Tax=Centroberyx affinis TaxID=166261 RepID=UPI003A5BDA9C